ncbi:hypothetical protein D9M73_269180 [compost metagenome]
MCLWSTESILLTFQRSQVISYFTEHKRNVVIQAVMVSAVWTNVCFIRTVISLDCEVTHVTDNEVTEIQ